MTRPKTTPLSSKERCSVFSGVFHSRGKTYLGLYVRLDGASSRLSGPDHYHVVFLLPNQTRPEIARNVSSPRNVIPVAYGYISPAQLQQYIEACVGSVAPLHADADARFEMWREKLLSELETRSPALFVRMDH